MNTIWALIDFSLLASQQTHTDVLLKYLRQTLGSFSKFNRHFNPQHATEARTKHLESDFYAQAATHKEVAMEMIEREHHREIYGITTGQRSTFEAGLKEEQQSVTTWNAAVQASAIV
jgi:hypothetical protein